MLCYVIVWHGMLGSLCFAMVCYVMLSDGVYVCMYVWYCYVMICYCMAWYIRDC